jgi:hypothetical protein
MKKLEEYWQARLKKQQVKIKNNYETRRYIMAKY